MTRGSRTCSTLRLIKFGPSIAHRENGVEGSIRFLMSRAADHKAERKCDYRQTYALEVARLYCQRDVRRVLNGMKGRYKAERRAHAEPESSTSKHSSFSIPTLHTPAKHIHSFDFIDTFTSKLQPKWFPSRRLSAFSPAPAPSPLRQSLLRGSLAALLMLRSSLGRIYPLQHHKILF